MPGVGGWGNEFRDSRLVLSTTTRSKFVLLLSLSLSSRAAKGLTRTLGADARHLPAFALCLRSSAVEKSPRRRGKKTRVKIRRAEFSTRIKKSLLGVHLHLNLVCCAWFGQGGTLNRCFGRGWERHDVGRIFLRFDFLEFLVKNGRKRKFLSSVEFMLFRSILLKCDRTA